MATAVQKPAPLQFSVPLPLGLDTRIFIHLTTQSKYILLFLTTASSEEAASAKLPMGSFVYSLPDRFKPSQPLMVPLVYDEPTLDFASQLARLLAQQVLLPVYVGSSVSFSSTIMGGSVEEQLATLRKVYSVVVAKIQGRRVEVDG